MPSETSPMKSSQLGCQSIYVLLSSELTSSSLCTNPVYSTVCLRNHSSNQTNLKNFSQYLRGLKPLSFMKAERGNIRTNLFPTDCSCCPGSQWELYMGSSVWPGQRHSNLTPIVPYRLQPFFSREGWGVEGLLSHYSSLFLFSFPTPTIITLINYWLYQKN